MKKRIFGIILFVLFLTVAATPVFAAGVKPLVVDLDMEPGDTQEFKLTLTPGSSEEKVNFSFYQPVQLTSGSLTYQEPEKETFPAVNWVDLETEETMVYPGEKKKISGEVKVPFTAEGGSHTVVIMVEPQKPARKQGGIKFMVRYAVRINIRVDRPGVRPEAKLINLGLEADEEDKPLVKAQLTNPSKLDYLVSGEATIRDSKRRLVERISLGSLKGRKANTDKTRMYPGSKVNYLGKVTKRLSPGEYDLRVFFRYADHGQIIKEKKITVKEGEFDFPSIAEMGSFTIKPGRINLHLRPGERKSKVIRLNSEIEDDTKIIASKSEVREKYKCSLVKWVKLRGRNAFILRGRRKGQVILTLAVPEEIEKGSYHGNILLKAYEPGSDKLLTEKEVPISVLIGEDHAYKVKIKSLYVKKVKEGQLLSLDLFNKGKVFVEPRAEVVIKNSKDEFVKRVSLTIPQDNKKILPFKSKRLNGIARNLKPGKYKAEITIEQEGEEIEKVTKEFKVKK